MITDNLCVVRSNQRNEFNTVRSPLLNSSALSKLNHFHSTPSGCSSGGNYQKSVQSPQTQTAISSHHHISPNIIYSNPYGDSSGYLQMALGAYLAPTSGGAYKSVDPYFLSQGEFLNSKVYNQTNVYDINIYLSAEPHEYVLTNAITYFKDSS